MIDKFINILFIGGAKRYSLAERFIESGKKMNYEIHLFSYEIEKDVPICGIAEIILGLKWKDHNIIEHIIKTITEKKINIVLPFVDPSISILADVKKNILPDRNIFIPVSSREICDLHYNKSWADKWFEENGFPRPLYREGSFPLIAKPIKGSASVGIIMINNQEEFEQFKRTNHTDEFLIQQFIDADEYTVDCYISQSGEILGIVPRKRLYVVNGEVTKSITVKHEGITELTEKILLCGDFRGPVTIQFLEDKKSKKIYIMEINPKFGGGVINSIEAGFDVPTLILREFLDMSNQRIDDWKNNLLMMRVNREVFKCKS